MNGKRVIVTAAAALAAVAIAPGHPLTRYVDLVGSLIVAGYLLWSGLRTAQKQGLSLKNPRFDLQKLK